jgi:hypothetical protein
LNQPTGLVSAVHGDGSEQPDPQGQKDHHHVAGTGVAGSDGGRPARHRPGYPVPDPVGTCGRDADNDAVRRRDRHRSNDHHPTTSTTTTTVTPARPAGLFVRTRGRPPG